MTPIKQILFRIQENEKKLFHSEMIENAEPLMKDYIQYLKNKLNLCKIFLAELSENDNKVREFLIRTF